MAKKGKRKKSGESGQASASIRPEAAAAESAVESSNVIQFPAKGARAVGATTQIAIGSGTVVTHDEDDGGRDTDVGHGADSEAPPAAPATEKVGRESVPPAATPRQRMSTPTPARGLSAVKGDAVSNTGEHAAVSDDFFGASPYPAQTTDDADDWGDLKLPEPVSASTKRAMFATAAIAATFLLIGGIYLFVQKVVLPQPEQLGGPPPVATLPTPIAAPEAPPEPLPPPTPVAAAPAVAAVDPALAAAPTGEAVAPEGVAPPAAEPAPADPVAVAAAVAPPAAPAPEPAAVAAIAPPAAPAAPIADAATELAAAKRLRGARKIEALTAFVTANPTNAEALALLGFEYLQRSNNRRALEFAERAVAIDPTSSQGWITVGAAKGGLGDGAGAREAYRNCVERGVGQFVRDCRAMR
jgi:hypothetical protein